MLLFGATKKKICRIKWWLWQDPPVRHRQVHTEGTGLCLWPRCDRFRQGQGPREAIETTATDSSSTVLSRDVTDQQWQRGKDSHGSRLACFVDASGCWYCIRTLRLFPRTAQFQICCDKLFPPALGLISVWLICGEKRLYFPKWKKESTKRTMKCGRNSV